MITVTKEQLKAVQDLIMTLRPEAPKQGEALLILKPEKKLSKRQKKTQEKPE